MSDLYLLQILSELFVILRKIQPYTIINEHGATCQILMKLNFLHRFSKDI
jgi:hypothetical protein